MANLKLDEMKVQSMLNGVSVSIPMRISIEIGLPEISIPQTTTSAQIRSAEASAVSAMREVSAMSELAEAAADEATLAYAKVAQAGWGDIAQSRFHWSNALALAACSHLAYSPPATVKQVCESQWRLSGTKFVQHGQTQCFVAAHSDALIVSFRGTKEILDWFTNLDMLERPTSVGSVHDGFYRAFTGVSARLESQIEQLGRDKPIVLTGHSLGGALATLAAAFWRGKYTIASVYTYGQPCVGFDSFQAFMNVQLANRFYRFVNADDIVPRVPPGYEHVGQLVRFDSGGNVVSRAVTESVIDLNAESLLDSVHESLENAQPPNLSPVEFESIKRQLEVASETSPLAQAAELVGRESESVQLAIAQREVEQLDIARLEGLFPNYFSDHRLTGYLAKIMNQLN